VNIRLIKKMYY